MRFSDYHTQARIKRRIDVVNGPILEDEYSRSGRKFRVERVEIEYTFKDGDWVVDSWSAVNITGTVLKKDGTDSANSTTRSPRYGWPRNLAIHPWLSKMVDTLRPTADLILATGFWDVELDGEDLA